MLFQFDQVEYTPECQALYLDGELLFSGDYYHDKINVSIEEYIKGFEKALEYCHIKQKINHNYHCIDEELSEKFADEGYPYPERFPNEYI